MKKSKLQVATVFSGIGAFEQALEKMNIQYNIVFASDNGERVIGNSYDEVKSYCLEHSFSDIEVNEYVKFLYQSTNKPNQMKQSYFANYDISEDNWYEDIRFINGKIYHNKVDILVGGSPCQSFSNMGKRKGLDDARGTLFYDYARLVKEIEPKVFIYENVPGMLNHNNSDTWKRIKEIFNSLNYKIFYTVLNSMDFGIPQNRSRLFVVGFKNQSCNFNFPTTSKLTNTAKDFLESNVAASHYLGKKGFEFVTNPKYKGRATINKDIIRTQKANQQFNWNGDFIFEPLDYNKHNKDILSRAYVGEWNGQIGVIRQLSHRECYRLMGFSDNYDFTHVNNVWRYRQAGNSIVVNVLEALIKEILKVESFDEKN